MSNLIVPKSLRPQRLFLRLRSRTAIAPKKQTIHREIWSGLVRSLDPDALLKAERADLLAGLFSDRFATAKKQQLSGLSPASEAYNMKLNELVESWRNDFRYCATRLVAHWKSKAKGAIVVVDNTDQYSAPIQDFCFSSAQEISSAIECVTLISMREERFHNSKMHGLLDAFQNSGFHISSPKPSDVFKRRLQYVIDLLSVDRRRRKIMHDVDEGVIRDSIIYLSILHREFSNEKSPLNAFLSACAHGNIRLSLDLFRSFALSGYTNVDEMVSNRHWNFLIHQVIKPMMTPSRYFYDERLSDIPNIYQIRNNRHGSHFTALRILRKLAKSVDSSAPAYVSVAELTAYFAETFKMVDDFVRNLDLLLKHGFVEANNRVDAYSEEVDQIKITNYGIYMLKELAYNFTYLDLICTDCGLYDESVHHYVIEAARKEYNHFVRHERLKRVELRVERVEHLINYLRTEEQRERDAYSLGMPESEMFTFKPAQGFEVEKERVLASARKNQGSKASPMHV